MKSTKALFSLFIIFSILTACSKKDTTPSAAFDCEFVQNDRDMDGLIDESERNLMEECRTNQLSSKAEIENNLIGEWELIGHGEGWVSTISKP